MVHKSSSHRLYGSKGNQKLTEGKFVVLELEQLPMTDQGLEPAHDENNHYVRKMMGKNGPELGSHGNPLPLKKVPRYYGKHWTAATRQTEINQQSAALIVPDCHIYYTLYNSGGHRSTWQHAYDLLPAMEWIFAQHK